MQGSNIIRVDLDGSGAGENTISLVGFMHSFYITHSGDTPNVTITDGADKALDNVTVTTSGTSYHTQAPILNNAGVDTGLRTHYMYTKQRLVTVSVTSGSTSGGYVIVEFKML